MSSTFKELEREREREGEREREREREREPRSLSVQSPHFGVPKSWIESLGGRSWMYETSRLFRHILHHKELIWEHLDPEIITIFSSLLF